MLATQLIKTWLEMCCGLRKTITNFHYTRVNFLDLELNYKTNDKDANYDLVALLWHSTSASIRGCQQSNI